MAATSEKDISQLRNQATWKKYFCIHPMNNFNVQCKTQLQGAELGKNNLGTFNETIQLSPGLYGWMKPELPLK